MEGWETASEYILPGNVTFIFKDMQKHIFICKTIELK